MTGLAAAEVERGWIEFHCDRHGFLVAVTPTASVKCACGKDARRFRHGRTVDPKTLKSTAAKARKLNAAGYPFIHACGDCGEDFGGRKLQVRHRAGKPSAKQCLSAVEMEAKGWRLDVRGRWRDAGNTDGLRQFKELQRLGKKSARPGVPAGLGGGS